MVTLTDSFHASFQAYTAPSTRVKRGSVVASFLGMVLGVLAGVTVRVWRGFKAVALTLAGLGCIAASAFTLGLGWGLLATGLSALVLEWRING